MPVLKQDFFTSLLNPRQLISSSPRSTPDLRTLDNQDCVRIEANPGALPIISLPDELDPLMSDGLDLQPLLPDKKVHRGRKKCKRNGINRSQSMRNSRQPQSATSSRKFRSRIASIPTEHSVLPGSSAPLRSSSDHSLALLGADSDFQRLRNFYVTPKGLVNRGDSFRCKSRSAHSVSSIGSQYFPSTTPPGSPNIYLSLPEVPKALSITVTDTERHRVLVVGASEVGKSSLTTQFTTSVYMCAYDNSQDEENEKSVTVVLNGMESELVFVECTAQDFLDKVKDSPSSATNYDAYVAVYSVTNKRSFRKTKEIINNLMIMDITSNAKAAILVGNKTDLVRLRKVSMKEGQDLATAHSWKFIETSTGINHNVDELLVGILSQIRLKCQQQERLKKQRESVTLTVPSMFSFCTGGKTKVFIKKILEKTVLKSRSCDNLHIL
ncbi:uncharacterized protein LOC106460330 [Limulus polyphemus]|uniref:Uncharacterized protein LOC106460330 n=1 Tax=Limulus polyphemus TaxID=6850 RepID=A0ABM1SGI5_LIMPO|nr:uncharacterized protein LOC106460330 [Limulus polyphemus]